MSVDLVATLPRPISLAAVVDTASATLADLLAVATTPQLHVIGFAFDERGAAVRRGRRLAEPELRDISLGVPGACVYVQVTLGGSNAAWLMDGEYHPDGDEGMVLSVSPDRSCAGVVLATAVALAAASAAGGDFIDEEIGMLRPPLRDPGLVVARTRLDTASSDVAVASKEYMRQFPHLNDWPADITAH
jgi:hypothetical protein